jgi:hypothetical protein
MRPTLGLALALCGLPVSLPAQQGNAPASAPPGGWVRPAEHYGKWITAAAAIGFTVLAAREHQTANDTWNQLLQLCAQDNVACTQRADGRYVDYSAELLYQKTLYYDHRARRRLVAGQLSLLASAALFILDLRHEHSPPPNIPFHGMEVSAEPSASGARLRVALPF